MRQLLSLSILVLFTSSLIGNQNTDHNRVKLANLTVTFFNHLSNKNYQSIKAMLNENFEMNGGIRFTSRHQSVDFLMNSYGNKVRKVHLTKIIVLNYHDLKSLKKSVGIKLSFKLLNKLGPNDWATVINKLSVDGTVISRNTSLVFRRSDKKWRIKGMFHQDK